MKRKMFGGVVIILIALTVLIVVKLMTGALSGEKEEIQGVVLNVNEQGMEIERMTIQTMEDGSIVGETGVGNPTAEIFFTEDTEVVIKEMTRNPDESVTTQEKPGSIVDIMNMSSVTAHVKSKGGVYDADKIEIWININ